MPAIAEEAKRAEKQEIGDLVIEIIGKVVRVYELASTTRLKQIAHSDTLQGDRFLMFSAPSQEVKRAKDFTVTRLYKKPERARKIIGKYFPKYAAAGAKVHLYYSGRGPRGRIGGTEEGYFTVALGMGVGESIEEARDQCPYYGKLILTLRQAYMDKKAKCPTCGRMWRVRKRPGKGTLRSRVTPDTNVPYVRIPKHKLQPKESIEEAFRYKVRGQPSNQASIAATLDDYKILPGIKKLPMRKFDASFKDNFYAVDDRRHIDDLKAKIKASGWVEPLIAVKDKEGYYILEGAHRMTALYELGAKTLPAMVVVDLESASESIDEAKAKKFDPAHYDGPTYKVGDRVKIVRRFGWKPKYRPTPIKPPVLGKVKQVRKHALYHSGPPVLILTINPKDFDRATPGVVHTATDEIWVHADEVESMKKSESIEERRMSKVRIISSPEGSALMFMPVPLTPYWWTGDKWSDKKNDARYYEKAGAKSELGNARAAAQKLVKRLGEAVESASIRVPMEHGSFMVEVTTEFVAEAKKVHDALTAAGIHARVNGRNIVTLVSALDVQSAKNIVRNVLDKSNTTFESIDERFDPKAAHDYVRSIPDRRQRAYAREYLKAIQGARLPPRPQDHKLTTQEAREVEAGFKRLGAPLAASVDAPTFEQVARIVRRAKGAGFSPSRITLNERFDSTGVPDLRRGFVKRPRKPLISAEEYIFVVHDDKTDTYSVGHSVHDDPRLGYQELQTGLSLRAANRFERKMKARWKAAKVRRFLKVGQGHERKWLPESDEHKTERIKDAVDLELQDPANKGLTITQVLRSMFKQDVDEARTWAPLWTTAAKRPWRLVDQDGKYLRKPKEGRAHRAYTFESAQKALAFLKSSKGRKAVATQESIEERRFGFSRGLPGISVTTARRQMERYAKEYKKYKKAGDTEKMVEIGAIIRSFARLADMDPEMAFKLVGLAEEIDEIAGLPLSKEEGWRAKRSAWQKEYRAITRQFPELKDNKVVYDYGKVRTYKIEHLSKNKKVKLALGKRVGKALLKRGYKLVGLGVYQTDKFMAQVLFTHERAVLKVSVRRSDEREESADEARRKVINKQPKEEVNYRESREDIDGDKRCGTCAFIIMPDACTRVRGKIEQDDLCDLWKRGVQEDLDEAAAQGKVQAALLDFVKKLPKDSEYTLADVMRRREFHNIHFKRLMSAAKSLAKKGLIWYDGMSNVGPVRA